MSWLDSSEWWREEVGEDPAYEEVVTPLLFEVLGPIRPGRFLDVGCGEGRVMRELETRGVRAHGIDINARLAASAPRAAVGDACALPVRDRSYDVVYSVLVLEHLLDHAAFFAETARVAVRGGVLALVANHPAWTAPESTPITDFDGEVLWRPGSYFSAGVTTVPIGSAEVDFHHRPLGSLLEAAAANGWSLERLIERPHHEYEDQAGIPRLLACRWRLIL